MQLKYLFALFTIALITLSVPARASSLCDRISDSDQRSHCQEQAARAQQIYSSRQRYLAQAVSQLIDTYYQRTGQVLSVTSQTVAQVMQLIGAIDSEAAFVVDRMVAHTRAIAALQEFQ